MTTLLHARGNMAHRPIESCHDGQGTIDFTEVLGKAQTDGRSLNFIHDDLLPPGSSIGVHRHAQDEEYYLIVEGAGTMTLDGTPHPVAAGDITAVYPGGQHGLVNDGDVDMRVIVISCG